jgi:hypothetical protein
MMVWSAQPDAECACALPPRLAQNASHLSQDALQMPALAEYFALAADSERCSVASLNLGDSGAGRCFAGPLG